MADESLAKVREVFEAAYEMPPEDRPAYLDRVCGEDPELRGRVETLLAAAEQEHPFLSEPTAARAAEGAPGFDIQATPSEAMGSTIGRYKLLEKIGEGGFGVVYMADQDQPVRRRVALKIIKPGMDSKQVIARFEAERQALAMMDHPCIARVLDAGETDLGHPYFVMDLVRGEPITQYCTRNQLSTRERLELFTQVCHAVQHAHQKGVIHRDIKPNNVLITVDGEPVPKIIDFGIAKATGGRLTDLTLFTEHRALIGTPTYMSPEQADMSSVDIDTRSDIYSLGVLLYELLTGTTPFDTKELMAAGVAEIQRIIREVEPEKPSTRLSTLRQTEADDARRPEDPGRLSSIVRGDLDWIVMKAMEKDRTRRYETADGLAADVARHLAGEAVLAAPPSAAYRVRKFVRRHRAGVTATSLVVLSLAGGVVGTTIGLVRAERQRGLAEKQREVAEKQREVAEARENETRQVANFQASLLTGIDIGAMGRRIKERYREQVRAALGRRYVGEFPDRHPMTPEQIEVEMAEFDERVGPASAVDVARRVMDEFVLAPAAEALEEQFPDQPRIRGQVHFAIGRTYRVLQMYDEAEPHLRQAMEMSTRVRGEEHVFTLVIIQELAGLQLESGNPAEAEKYIRKALNGYEHLQGKDASRTLTALGELGRALKAQGKLSEAERCYDQALEARRRIMGNDDPNTLATIANLGELRMAQGDIAAAEPLQREALQGFRRVLGDDHERTLIALNNMANLHRRKGEYAEAESYYREAEERCRRVLGNENSTTLSVVNNLGRVLSQQGKLAEAEPFIEEAVEVKRRVFGDAHRLTLSAITSMGRLRMKQGKLAEAEACYREVMEMDRRRRGSPGMGSLNSMASVLQAQGRLAEAEPLHREVLEQARRARGDNHPSTLVAIHNLGQVLYLQGRLDAARALYADGLRAAQAGGLGEYPQAATIERHYADVLRETGDLDEAIDLARSAVERYRAHPEWPREDSVHARRVLIEVILAVGDPALLDDAEEEARESLEVLQTLFPEGHYKLWKRADMMSVLGEVLIEQAAGSGGEVAAGRERLREAESLLTQSADWFLENAESIPTQYRADRVRDALERLVSLYETWDAIEPGSGKVEQAARWRAELGRLPRP